MTVTHDWISYDPATNTLTIEGIKYSHGFFKQLARGDVGSLFRIVRREDSILTVECVFDLEDARRGILP